MVGRVTEINLPYVHAFRDRHGRMRYYVRRKGKRTPLPGLPGSQAFMDAYHAALKPEPEAPAIVGKSVAALIQSFYKSAGFQKLSPSSRDTYRIVLSKIEEKHGHRSAVELPEDKAAKIIEDIGEDRPALANLTASVLRKVFAHAIKPLRWRNTNPFSGIERYQMGTHHTWTDKEIEAFEKHWPIGTRQRLAFDLLLYTAQRIGDVVRMKRAEIIDGKIAVTQEKTGAKLLIPIHPELRKSINAYGFRGQYIIGSVNGQPIQDKNLSAVMIRAAVAAGLPRKCVPHGIRKAALRILAERGMSLKVIASLSGHKTLKELERYTEAADQAQLAETAVANLGRSKWQT